MSGNRFLVDTNTFITPYKTYYPFDLAPSFWRFLKYHIENGSIGIMSVVYDEVRNVKAPDHLRHWFQSLQFTQIDHRTEDVLCIYGQIMSHIQNKTFRTKPGEERNLYSEKALAEWAEEKCADPWLVAAAKAKEYIVVTLETKNSQLGVSMLNHPKIPDVASAFDVKCSSLFDMMRTLGFVFR